jgi:hypothetical protein
VTEEQFPQPTDRHRLLADHFREVLVGVEDLLDQLGIFWIERRLGPARNVLESFRVHVENLRCSAPHDRLLLSTRKRADMFPRL